MEISFFFGTHVENQSCCISNAIKQIQSLIDSVFFIYNIRAAAAAAAMDDEVVVLSSEDEAGPAAAAQNTRRRRRRAVGNESVMFVEEPRTRAKRTICQTCGMQLDRLLI